MSEPKIGLVLTGGGARAAYQVGVLKGIGQILPRHARNPFPIICGTSAGAINALSLAARPGPFRHRMRQLESVWSELRAEEIYRTDSWGILKNTFYIALSFIQRGKVIGRPRALLDNAPLWELMKKMVDFGYITDAIDSQELHAVSVSTMSYASGHTETFYQGHDSIHDWQFQRRSGKRTPLTIEHLIASSSIPMVFPSVQINGHYYGDGAVRQLTPLSPALHLGADKLVIIGVSDRHREGPPPEETAPPTVAQIMGHMYNSAFIDALENDLRSLKIVNKVLRRAERVNNGPVVPGIRPVDCLVISPSRPLNELAAQYYHELPKSIKTFFSLTGGSRGAQGSSAASYLLFEPGFLQALIALGYHDALAKHDDIRAFFNVQPND